MAKIYLAAAKTFKRFIDHSTDKTYLETARFRFGWMYHLANKDNEAAPLFSSYLASYPDGRYASICEFILLQKMPEAEKPDAMLRFVKKYPVNFYSYLLLDQNPSMLEAVRQNLAEEKLAAAMQFDRMKTDIDQSLRMQVYRELKAVGLNDDAVKLLKTFTYDSSNEWLALYVASEFHELDHVAGEVKNLLQLVSNNSSLTGLIPWQRIYPTYKFTQIELVIAELKLNISPYLVLSLIRQESAFDPEAHSKANAQGLMQLTMGAAKPVARELALSEIFADRCAGQPAYRHKAFC